MTENCSECIYMENGKCKLKPAACLNCDHFQWSPMIQISMSGFEKRYVSRLAFDEMKARAEKAEARLDDNYSKFKNIKNAITEGSIQAANIIYRGMINSNAILPSEKIRIGMAKIIENEINLKIQSEKSYTVQPSETTNWSAEEILKREG